MTRRYGESKTSASRRALLPIVGAIPLALAVTCASATGDAAARPSVPAPAPFAQLWTSPVQPGVTLRAINWQNLYAPEPVGVDAFSIPVPNSVPDTMLDKAKNAAASTNAFIDGGLQPVLDDTRYSDRVTGLTVGGGVAGLVIGAAVGAVPAAVIGAVPGAVIGAAIGAIAGSFIGGVALAIPTLGVGAPMGAMGGALAGAGVGAVVGAVVGGVVTAVPVGIVGAAVGYELGAATGTGIGLQS
ncbi:hypothetical protein GFY24_39965 [Nocardia sp. SYP-A9097]|uniref:hypothetical protein n=1 Tax=Nocardia sp. SYP-A9097 TaxID=2663237 RepID=UPI00129A270E|nr:hypothetical protein [Nocardia sp. SYP-A9097]MRH93510.1 hypothetical protein [Nocardia sp. SYP-A9097]